MDSAFLSPNALKIVNNNQVYVSVLDIEVCSLIDTGVTVSTLNKDVYEKIKTNPKVVISECHRQCMLADGSKIYLNTMIALPITVVNLTFEVNLFVLKNQHMHMIMGCDTYTQTIKSSYRFQCKAIGC